MAGSHSECWPALVDTKWLVNARRDEPNLRILDGSWHMSYLNRDTRKEFGETHIHDAQFFDLNECADKQSQYGRHMLPTSEQFADYVGHLGVSNDSLIVVYDCNTTVGMFSAARVWWMFRVFGHKKVSVLNGGLCKWIESGLATTSQRTAPVRQKYVSSYVGKLVKTLEDVEENVETRKSIVIDCRRPARFNGALAESKPNIKPGHIVNSTNIHYARLLARSKLFKTPKELIEVFGEACISLEKDPIIASCGSGITACMIALAAYTAGNRDVPVFDGSWTEFFLCAKPDNKVLTSHL